MHHTDYILEAARVLNQRQKEYGEPDLCFDRIAAIASTLMGMPITPYQVAQMHIATKLARSIESPAKVDTWVDIINYAAFAGNFASNQAQPEAKGETSDETETVYDLFSARPDAV